MNSNFIKQMTNKISNTVKPTFNKYYAWVIDY